jgi:hypothetical protein
MMAPFGRATNVHQPENKKPPIDGGIFNRT